MHKIEFKNVGPDRRSWVVYPDEFSHQVVLTLLAKSKALPPGEVWFSDPDYSDDGACEAGILINGVAGHGHFIATPLTDAQAASVRQESGVGDQGSGKTERTRKRAHYSHHSPKSHHSHSSAGPARTIATGGYPVELPAESAADLVPCGIGAPVPF